jgi:hypothetical protein
MKLHSGNPEEYYLVGCEALHFGRNLLRFRWNRLFYSEDGGNGLLKMLVNLHQTTRCHIPENNILQNNGVM